MPMSTNSPENPSWPHGVLYPEWCPGQHWRRNPEIESRCSSTRIHKRWWCEQLLGISFLGWCYHWSRPGWSVPGNSYLLLHSSFRTRQTLLVNQLLKKNKTFVILLKGIPRLGKLKLCGFINREDHRNMIYQHAVYNLYWFNLTSQQGTPCYEKSPWGDWEQGYPSHGCTQVLPTFTGPTIKFLHHGKSVIYQDMPSILTLLRIKPGPLLGQRNSNHWGSESTWVNPSWTHIRIFNCHS